MVEALHDLPAGSMAAALEANMVELFGAIGRLPGADLHDSPEMLRFTSGIDSPMFNGIARARLTSGNIDAAIEQALTPFREQKIPMFWWIGPSTLPRDLGSHLEAHGLEPNWYNDPGMAMDLHTVKEEHRSPAGLTIEPVSDLQGLDAWREAFVAGNEVPESSGDAWKQASASLGIGPGQVWRLYTGWLDGKPVATAMMLPTAGVVGLYAIGTVPGMRGMGIGAAITLAPLVEARDEGYRDAILTASPMGHPLYKRIGFQECCRVSRYLLSAG